MPDVEMKSFESPDEVRTFEKGKTDLLKLATGTVGRLELQPGWKWSEHVKPIVKTEWCEQGHVGYVISGRMRVRMSDGKEYEMGPGEVGALPPGHDAWVVGNEPYVGLDWAGSSTYAKPPA
jgi:quercetin dioxygenase-like cupin family protein